MVSEYIKIVFHSENKEYTLDYNQPNLALLIRYIIQNNLNVSPENISVESDIEDFDNEEFKTILVEAHSEFSEELAVFYKNISTTISTYYNDEDLSAEIIRRVTNTQES